MRTDFSTHWRSFLYLIGGTALFLFGLSLIPDPSTPQLDPTPTLDKVLLLALAYVVLAGAVWVVTFIGWIVFVKGPSRALARQCLIASMSFLSGALLVWGVYRICIVVWYVGGHTGESHWDVSKLAIFVTVTGGWLIGAAIRGSWRGFALPQRDIQT